MLQPAIGFLPPLAYLAIALGAFAEGEFSMIAGGALAALGWVSLPGAVTAGLAGVMANDLGFYWLGRSFPDRAGRYLPRMFARLDEALALMRERGQNLVIYFQFFDGQAAITPAAFGLVRFPFWRFVGLDAIGATLWSVMFGLVGIALGAAIRSFTRGPAVWLVVFAALSAVAFLFIRVARILRQGREAGLVSAPTAAARSVSV